MAILKVAKMGNPVLRRTADEIPKSEIKSDRIQRLIVDMFDTMEEYGGVGLAAPQVHESIRLLTIADIPDPDTEDGYLSRRRAVINPELTFLTDDEIAFFEGCLSIPDFRGQVPRIRKLRLRGFDQDGRKIDEEVEGFPAVVYQHEVDHLNGIMFLDRMPDLKTLTYLKEFDRYWARSEVVVD